MPPSDSGSKVNKGVSSLSEYPSSSAFDLIDLTSIDSVSSSKNGRGAGSLPVARLVMVGGDA